MSANITAPRITVLIRYVFGIREADGRPERTLDLAEGQTVLDVLRTLDLSKLELLTAVNGEVVKDHTMLRDGDELTLIPAIQGG